MTAGQLEAVALWRETHRSVVARMAGAAESVLHAQTMRALIDGLVTDWVEATAQRLERAGAASVDAVRASRAARRASPSRSSGPASSSRISCTGTSTITRTCCA